MPRWLPTENLDLRAKLQSSLVKLCNFFLIKIITCGTFLYRYPPRSTQPGHPVVGRRNEYQPKGGDALRLGVKAGMVRV